MGHSVAGLMLPTLLGMIPEAMIEKSIPPWLRVIEPIILLVGFFAGAFAARIHDDHVARWVWVSPAAMILLGIVFSRTEVRVGLAQNPAFLFLIVGPFFSGLGYSVGHLLAGQKQS